jgi:hypothetical protein
MPMAVFMVILLVLGSLMLGVSQGWIPNPKTLVKSCCGKQGMNKAASSTMPADSDNS